MDTLVDKFNDLDVTTTSTSSTKCTSSNKYTLYRYQQETINWMCECERVKTHGITGGIIALEMGAGKTLISLHHIYTSAHKGPTLVIVNKGLICEWLRQKNDFFGDEMSCYIHHSDFNKRALTVEIIESHDFVIATYNCVSKTYKAYVKDHDSSDAVLMNYKWSHIFTDESHKFCNKKTTLFKAMTALKGDYKWCLTGTPLRNDTEELRSLFVFCGYTNKVRSQRAFDSFHIKFYGIDKHLKMLRIADIGMVLPKKHVMIHYVNKHRDIQIPYEIIANKARKVAAQMMLLPHHKWQERLLLFKRLMGHCCRMRQLLIHPAMITFGDERNESKIMNGTVTLEHKHYVGELFGGLYDVLWDEHFASPKIEAVLSLIYQHSDSRVLVFSTFVYPLLVLKKLCKRKSAVIYGDVNQKRRYEHISNIKSGDIDVIFATYNTCCEGYNITECNIVILLDLWWCPTSMHQAIARAHRQGQNREVYIYKVLCKDSIDTKLANTCSVKDDIVEDIYSINKRDKPRKGPTMNDIISLVE